MVFGAFDGLHPGHISFFQQAKSYGDYLIVSVGTDKNVTKIKKRAPLFNETDRRDLISHIDIIDEAIIGGEDDFYEHIKDVNPDVICLGYDQWATVNSVRRALVKKGLSAIEVYKLDPFNEDTAKSTNLKNKSVDF
jgi:FAD synthetase